MAIEDAMTLAECLERPKSKDEIPQCLRAYQWIRQPRCKLVQEWGSAALKRAILSDGLEQQERDKKLKAFNNHVFMQKWDGVHVDELPESINSSMWTPWLLGHDAVGFAKRKLDEEFGAVKTIGNVV